MVATGQLKNLTEAATAAWSADGRFRWEVRERGERAVALALGDGTVAVVGSKNDIFYTRSVDIASGQLRWQARTDGPGGWSEAADVTVDPASQAVYATGFTTELSREFLTWPSTTPVVSCGCAPTTVPLNRSSAMRVSACVDPVRRVVHVVGEIGTDFYPSGFDSPSDLGLLSYAAADGQLLRVGQFSAGADSYLHAVDLDLDPESGIVVPIGNVVYEDEATVTVAFRPVS